MTDRVTIDLGGRRFGGWTKFELTRSLEEIAGGFTLELHDVARAERAYPSGRGPAEMQAVEQGQACTLRIDGEVVLVGHVDEVKASWIGDAMRVSLTGRDKAGDLVDCAALPDGPAELRGLTLTEIARRICAPYGISVRADVDVGAALPVFAVDASETALSAIEKAARQRGVLVVSDGVGGLVLTRGGATRGPAPLVAPGNIQEAVANLSWMQRFRDYIVKGQTRGANGNRRLDGSAAELTAASPPTPTATRTPVRERAGIVMTGRARDEAVGRHRPTVQLAKTQSGGASVQVQAEWRMRVARAKSDTLTVTVLDWRAGDDNRLWRPNELVAVTEPFSGLSGDMLISSVTYDYGTEALTRMELVGPEAFDLEPIEPRARGRQARRGRGGAQDGRARELTVETTRRGS